MRTKIKTSIINTLILTFDQRRVVVNWAYETSASDSRQRMASFKCYLTMLPENSRFEIGVKSEDNGRMGDKQAEEPTLETHQSKDQGVCNVV